MLQSLLAMPIAATAEVLLFLLLYGLTPLGSTAAALAVVLLAILSLLAYSLIDWPGADVLAMYIAVLSVTAYLLAIIASARDRRRAGDAGGRWFHWGPALLVLFFLVLFAFDSLFVFVSRDGLPGPLSRWVLPHNDSGRQVKSVFPGVISRDFQKKEALYNDYLQQVEKQQARGWQISKGWLGTPVVGRSAVFQVRIVERDGTPVMGAKIAGVYQRASDSRLDQPFTMKELQDGYYQATLSLPEPGHWDLELIITRGEQRHELHARTSVQAAPEQQLEKGNGRG